MLKIAQYLDQTYAGGDPSRTQLQFSDVLTWGRKNRFIGMILPPDVLVLDYKCMMSFRVSLTNLVNLRNRIHVFRLPEQWFEEPYLREYFRFNQDNPYSLWNVLRSVITGEQFSQFTQLPPLCPKKDAVEQQSAIDNMQRLAQPADSIFTYDRASGLHRLIRKYDRGMFGHCALVGEDGTINESTLSGIVESQFASLYDTSLDVALYRIDDLESAKRSAIAKSSASMVGTPGYNWPLVIRLFLWKRFGIPFRRGPADVTPADLIHSNKFKLICYA